MQIRQLRVSDAVALKACFIECYGNSYANELFYDVAALTGAIADGRLVSVVAVAEDRVLGHTGLSLAHPSAKAAEAGNTVVSPAARGQGLLGKLGAALGELTVAREFCGYTHYPTTAHDIMQKRATSGTGKETGIMLAYIPAETDYADFEPGAGRLAATVVYQPFTDGPEANVFAPKAYVARLKRFATALKLDRQFATGDVPTQHSSELENTRLGKRHLTRVTVNRVGADLPDYLKGQKLDGVVHVDLPMDDTAAGWAAEALGEQGFVYAGWLPYFAGSDVLRLQRVPDLTEAESSPLLVTGEAEVILAEILVEHREGQPVRPAS